MDYWTLHGSTISHIPTVGWAIVSEGELVLVRSSLLELLEEVDDGYEV